MEWVFGKFPWVRIIPKLGKFVNLRNSLGFPIWEMPGREKFEAIQVGGNGNFLLNIPGVETQNLGVMGLAHCMYTTYKYTVVPFTLAELGV